MPACIHASMLACVYAWPLLCVRVPVSMHDSGGALFTACLYAHIYISTDACMHA